MNIKELAIGIAESVDDGSGEQYFLDPEGWIADFAEALVAELAKENEPVAWWNGKETAFFEHEVDGPVGEVKIPLYTLPPTAEQIEQQTAEACAKVCKALADCDENTEPYRQGASWCEEAIRSGAWKEYK